MFGTTSKDLLCWLTLFIVGFFCFVQTVHFMDHQQLCVHRGEDADF